MFENTNYNGVFATRFIASWINAGGQLVMRKDVRNFKRWMESLGIDDADFIRHTIDLATNGKLELESSATRFLENINSNDN